MPDWHQVESPGAVNAVVVESDAEAWAAGTVAGYVSGFFHWDGDTWALADTFRNQIVYDICTVGPEAWAVGEQFNFPDGVVFRREGGHWWQEADPFDRSLQAVAFSDSAHGFAGGAAPVTEHPVMKYADGEWRIDSALTTRRTVCGIASPWSGKCYAVGDSGAILLYDYGTWKQKTSLTNRILRRVAMESNTEGWAVGDGGTILRCFKDSWTLVPSPTTRNLRGLAVAGTSGEAWAVGDSGTIVHCVMDSWHLEQFAPDPPDVPLYAVSFNSGTHGWAFGYGAAGAHVALRFYDPLSVEELAAGPGEPASAATFVRNVLSLPPASGVERQASGVLLDIIGRKVAELHPGACCGSSSYDVRALAPGVYFVREGREAGDAGQGQVRKVVIAR